VRSRRAAAIAFIALSIAACAPARRAKSVPVVRPISYEERENEASRTYLLLRLAERRLYLVTYDGETSAASDVESFPVAVGRPQWQTPTGVFRVTDKLVDPDWVQFDWNDPSHVIRTIPPGPDNPLGRRWIGFASGYGWQIGFHGTPHPELLGHAVSHGCVRMRNEDVVKVYDRVSVGTVVIVQP